VGEVTEQNKLLSSNHVQYLANSGESWLHAGNSSWTEGVFEFGGVANDHDDRDHDVIRRYKIVYFTHHPGPRSDSDYSPNFEIDNVESTRCVLNTVSIDRYVQVRTTISRDHGTGTTNTYGTTEE
jgi:hypothetical protein